MADEYPNHGTTYNSVYPEPVATREECEALKRRITEAYPELHAACHNDVFVRAIVASATSGRLKFEAALVQGVLGLAQINRAFMEDEVRRIEHEAVTQTIPPEQEKAMNRAEPRPTLPEGPEGASRKS